MPIVTSTTITAWTDRALDSQRLNLREESVAVREAQARIADDYRQRGLAGPDQVRADRHDARSSAKTESVARGFQDGLKFLSLVMLGFGLPLVSLLYFSPPRQHLIPDLHARSGMTPSIRSGRAWTWSQLRKVVDF